HFRQVVYLPLRLLNLIHLGAWVVFGAETVKVLQAAIDNSHRHRLTPRTAHQFTFPGNSDRIMGTGRHRQAAVIAGMGGTGCGHRQSMGTLISTLKAGFLPADPFPASRWTSKIVRPL